MEIDKHPTITISRSQVPGYKWLEYCKELGADNTADEITIEIKSYALKETRIKRQGLSKKTKDDFKDLIATSYKDDEEEDIEEEPEIEPLPAFELSEREQRHIKVLENLAKKCYSHNDTGFYVKDKLEAIKKELECTEYHIIEKDHFLFCHRPTLKDLDKNSEIIIVSSHADNVEEITKPFSELSENNQYLKGTYDNLGTNAASTILMQENQMPDNVIFAFTANEESGKCTGLKAIVDNLRNLGYNNLKGIALDVTYEGYDEGMLCSLENMSTDMIETSYQTLLSLEPEDTQTFTVTPISNKKRPKDLNDEYDSGSTGMFDEGMAFKKRNVPACSLCLPCDGDMHGNSGVKVRQPQFEGYVLSLEALISSLCKTNDKLIEQNKEKRKALSGLTADLIEHEPKPKYNFYGYGSGYSYQDIDYGGYYETPWISEDDEFDMQMESELCELASYCRSPEEFFEAAELNYGCDITDERTILYLSQFLDCIPNYHNEDYDEDYDDDDYN